jgi:hypothetical protein
MKIFLFIIFFSSSIIYSQEDLLSLIDDIESPSLPIQGTFKATRIVNAQSIEMARSKTLEFIIFHRFGSMSNGFYDLYGLDEASVRFDLSYGINENLSLGFGRSSFMKTYDLFTKFKILSQKPNNSLSLASIVLFSKVEIATIDKSLEFKNRLVYDAQLLIARKINQNLSLQIMPTVIHKNLIQWHEVSSRLYSLGIGGRVKVTRRVSLNADTFIPLGERLDSFNQSWGFGCDIETGGHVFQLLLTNAQGTFESSYIENSIGGSEMFFGFNITRSFSF